MIITWQELGSGMQRCFQVRFWSVQCKQTHVHSDKAFTFRLARDTAVSAHYWMSEHVTSKLNPYICFQIKGITGRSFNYRHFMAQGNFFVVFFSITDCNKTVLFQSVMAYFYYFQYQYFSYSSSKVQYSKLSSLNIKWNKLLWYLLHENCINLPFFPYPTKQFAKVGTLCVQKKIKIKNYTLFVWIM